MHLHEYQAKALLNSFGIQSPPFRVIESLDQLQNAWEELGLKEGVLKAQVHAGGRGKAGGVLIASSLGEACLLAPQLFGKRIVNRQTPPEGLPVHQILVTPKVQIAKEYYVAVAFDRKREGIALMLSCEGGVEIEKNAKDHLFTFFLPTGKKLRRYHLIEIGKWMGWEREVRDSGTALIEKLVDAFSALDATLLEINPLCLTREGKWTVLDAKITLDDNALFRHKEIAASFDERQETLLESLARKQDLSYISLQGNIGCMVNGAGLAMATLDIIELHGGSPANFLDVGGGASQEKIAQGFKIILQDSKVKALLINIFGGIMNCATLASGIVAAAKEQVVTLPLVVRMEGNHAEEGKNILKSSSLSISVVDSLEEAAKVVVQKAS